MVDSNAFQTEGSTANSISDSTAILIVFLSDADFKSMEHIYISLVVHHAECKLYDQSGILPFIETINDDLEMAHKKRIQKLATLLLTTSGHLWGHHGSMAA